MRAIVRPSNQSLFRICAHFNFTPKISSSARWKSFSSQKEQISDHMRSLYWVFNLLAKAANTRMKAKAKNTKNTKLNWTTMQCNDCFVSAPIATDHFMCSFLAAKFAIGFRNTKTIGTDLVSGWWCRDILTDLSASSTFTFIEGTWCNQRPKTLIEGQHGATSDLYGRNMVQLEAKGWEVGKRKALATSTWQHVPI